MTLFSVAVIATTLLSISFNSELVKSEEPAVREISFESGGPRGSWAGHGGPSGTFSVSWNVATCKTDCERKIGFRCGRVKIVRCLDGSAEVIIVPSTCPDTRARLMEADVTFYSNNTIKLFFLNSMPEEELSNSIFEVEDGEENANDLELPSDMLLDKVHYKVLRLIPGDYKINYGDGKFGSVIIDAELLK